MIPSVTQMQLDGAGMQYVIQLCDGEFIIIDGGVNKQSDTVRLFDYLCEKTPADKKPTIAAWMFTHSDPDHIQLASNFIVMYAEAVKIRAFFYHFPDMEQMHTIQDDEAMRISVDELEGNMSEYHPNAVKHIIHTGEVYHFEGVKVEILLTCEEFSPSQAKTYNETSAAWRMIFDNGIKVLFLGDCMKSQCTWLAQTYGTYLKSDFLQLAHHGLIGGDLTLYQLVDPGVCFWPTDVERFYGTYERYKHKYCLGEGGCDYNAWIRDETIRKREHYHNGETTTIYIQGKNW